ncbi:MAG: hypothetical protein J7493_13895 [Porphyrobacter sp.]|nr:hypothetical protein [Porphyrobacter sp.]
MKNRTRLAFLAIVGPLTLATPATARERLPSSLAQLSPNDFASRVRIIDDPLEPVIILSSQDGYKRSRSIGGARADDVYLQALINRETGQVSWQVWHELSMTSERKLDSVEYRGDSGTLQKSGFLAMEDWLDQCPPTDGIGSCNHVVRIAFELPDRTLREIADAYRPGERTGWLLRFKEINGQDITSGLAPAEAAGLILALEKWKRAGAAGA